MSNVTIPFFRRFCRKIVYLTAPIWSDEMFLRLYFWCNLGYKLDLKNPRTFNEKINWLKLYDRHKEYSVMVDKKEAKEYVSSLIGSKYIIPTLAVYNSVDEIDFEKLPNQFVLKCTHDSGGIVVCKDKTLLDRKKAVEKLRVGLKSNFVSITREYPYKSVKPRIIAEEYMEDETGYELRDYKIFCFDGEPKYLFVASDRQKEGEDTKFDFFDLDWNHIPVTNGHPNAKVPINKPKNFEEMIEVAKKLSKGIPHVRVDLYNCNGKIYFGELTFFHWGGMTPYDPIEWDYKFGEYIHLPINKK